MAIFQPTMITPDVRGGLGNGVIDAARGMTVSWQVNGPSPMTAAQVTIYNDAGSAVLTENISLSSPFFGVDNTGAQQTFSHDIPMRRLATAGIRNGSRYTMAIRQYWSASEYIDQYSPSVFYARTTPTLSVDPIGTVTTNKYTFTGTYAQAQGDALNWFRWQVAPWSNVSDPIFDTGNVYGSMDVRAFCDGLFDGTEYAVRLTAQTAFGVQADTGWTRFSVDYGATGIPDELEAACAKDTDAVRLSWNEDAAGLSVPTAAGNLTFNGQAQSPTWNGYDPTQLQIGGTTSATNAGTYTATFTPQPGYSWGSSAESWAVYRKGPDGRFVHIVDVPAGTSELYDYGAASRQGPYTYYVFPMNASGGAGTPLVSRNVSPCYKNWSLVEAAETNGGFVALTEYRFSYNISSGSMGNNNRPNLENNFTRYPTYMGAPQNYKGGSLSALIGVVDYENNATYSDTLSLRNRLFGLSTTRNALFLKSPKGDFLQVRTNGPVEFKTADAAKELTQTITLPWVEIADASSVTSLAAIGNISAGETTVSPNLTLTPASFEIDRGMTQILIADWRGGGQLSVTCSDPAVARVEINGRNIIVTGLSAGNVTITATVSQSGVYFEQSAASVGEVVEPPLIAVPYPYTNSSLTYNGQSQEPVWVGYDSAVMRMTGDVSGTDAGTYTTVFVLNDGYMWEDGALDAADIDWAIGKASPELTATPNPLTVTAGETETLTISRKGDGAVTAVSSDTGVATVTVIDTTGATVVQAPSQSGALRYDGASKTPTWNGYDASIMTLSGTTSGTNPGSYGAVFSLADGYIWPDTPRGLLGSVTGVSVGSGTITVSVAETKNYLPETVTVNVTVEAVPKQSPELSVSPTTFTVSEGSTTTLTASRRGSGAISAVSSDTGIATVSVSGTSITVSGVAEGSVTITVSVAETDAYTADSAGVGGRVESDSTSFLRFSSPSSFTLAMKTANKYWNGTIQWRSGGNDWSTWDGTTTLSSASGTIDLRGIGNTTMTQGFSGVGFVLTGTDISCIGNIETLLDYQTVANGQHPSMQSGCFIDLFMECDALVAAPELPALTLANQCYERMFGYCTALTTPPVLPATQLANNCYLSMFLHCTNLQALPVLAATDLPNSCYANMFNGCTSVKISETQTGTYQYAYRIPQNGTGTITGNPTIRMFDGTGGTFTDDPQINTTYYTDHQPVS